MNSNRGFVIVHSSLPAQAQRPQGVTKKRGVQKTQKDVVGSVVAGMVGAGVLAVVAGEGAMALKYGPEESLRMQGQAVTRAAQAGADFVVDTGVAGAKLGMKATEYAIRKGASGAFHAVKFVTRAAVDEVSRQADRQLGGVTRKAATSVSDVWRNVNDITGQIMGMPEDADDFPIPSDVDYPMGADEEYAAPPRAARVKRALESAGEAVKNVARAAAAFSTKMSVSDRYDVAQEFKNRDIDKINVENDEIFGPREAAIVASQLADTSVVGTSVIDVSEVPEERTISGLKRQDYFV